MSALPALLAAALLLAAANGGAQPPAAAPATLDARTAPLRCGAVPQAVNEAGYVAKARPGLFQAYVGAAQLVNSTENMRTSREALLALARGAGDNASVAKLEALGAPPWRDPRSFGVLRRIDRKYEALATDPAPAAWWKRADDYLTAQELIDDEAGEDYSYLQFVGRNGDGMFAQVDLPALGADFALPVFIVHGAEDLLTTPAVAKRYFDSIRAPQKEFVLLPRGGHDPNQALLDAQLKLLNERVRPLVK